MTDVPWKEFEKLAYEIQQGLAGGDAVVTLRDTIQGEDSGIPRQIDISIRQQVGPHSILIIADCKAHKVPVDINIVEQFGMTVRDVRANKGALISSSGFTSKAIDMARAHGIDTFRLVDTANTNWRAYVSIPTLLNRTRLVSASCRFTGEAPAGTSFPSGDPWLWEIRASDGTPLGTVRDLMARKWNAHEIPEIGGSHEVVLAADAQVGEDTRISATLLAVVTVSQEYYFGDVPIQTRGFQNVQTGGLIIREFKSELISPHDIEQGRVPGWRKVDDPSKLAVHPVMELAYSDAIPMRTGLGGRQ